jgi:hypothetical protein
MVSFPPDWNEFIGLLNAHRVRFLVVGAHALAANGRPRATADLDIFIEASPKNVERLARALMEFGFGDLGREARRFLEPKRIAALGTPPLRIDIMNHIDGVSFARAWKGRLRARLGQEKVAFLGLAELRATKKASGRPKDIADLALLGEMTGERRTKRR